MGLAAELVDDPARLQAVRGAWDALAVELGRPYCAPGWMLAWWDHARPPRALLRTVLVRDGDELVAVAPFYADRRFGRPVHYRLLAADISHRVGLLITERAQSEAPAAIAEVLAGSTPRPAVIRFENVEAHRGWPQMLASRWPGRSPPWMASEWSGPAPFVRLDAGSFAEWLAAKSRNFRSQEGRMRRHLEADGARFRLASTSLEADEGLEGLARLHYARWEGRGGSMALDAGVEHMLADAASDLLADCRFRLFTIEAHGSTISAHLFVAAGGQVAYWNGGFDESFAGDQPSMRVLVGAIQDAMGRSDRSLDLGGGSEAYKLRLADGEDLLETCLVVPRDAGYWFTRARLVPRRVRRQIGARLPDRLRPRPRGNRKRRR